MSRTLLHALAAAVLFAAPGSVFAQKEPPRPKELKEAEKFIATAQITKDSADRRSRYERALNPLQQALAKDANNAFVWFAMGQVHAGLSDFARADSAFRRAEELYAPIAKDVNDERLRAWGAALNAGVDMMDKQNYPAAIELLEDAEAIYPVRPESKLNLAVLYANRGDMAKSEAMFRAVVDLVKAPPAYELSEEEKAQWARFKDLSTVNLASLLGQRGVEAFEAERYDDAVAVFREAHQLNPQSRDYSYNLAESMFASARKLEENRKQLQEQEKAARAKKDAATANARADAAKQIAAQINALYRELEPLTEHALEMDPNNKDLYLLRLRSYQVRGDLARDAAAKASYQKKLNDLLAVHEALPAEIKDITIATGPNEATVKGNLRNLKLKAGSPVKLQLKLLGLNGNVIGEDQISITAPAPEQSVAFETKTAMTGELAGWKYEIVK